MATQWNFDLRNDTPDSVDTGGQPGVGFYHGRLDDVYEDTKQEDTTVLEFVILAPAGFAGRKLFYRFGGPGGARNDADLKTRINRAKMLASRLGLIGEGDTGKQDVGIDFTLAIGWEGVVEVSSRTYTADDGNEKTAVGVGYSAIWPAGHKDLAKKKLPPELVQFAPADLFSGEAAKSKRAPKKAGGTNGHTTTAQQPQQPAGAGGGARAGASTPPRGGVTYDDV